MQWLDCLRLFAAEGGDVSRRGGAGRAAGEPAQAGRGGGRRQQRGQLQRRRRLGRRQRRRAVVTPYMQQLLLTVLSVQFVTLHGYNVVPSQRTSCM